MHIKKRVSEWWETPSLPPRKVKVPRRLRDVDPTKSDYELPELYRGTVGSFKPPQTWVYYNRLASMDVGFIVPVYDLKQIGRRYGLTHNGMIYFRKHILPEPFDIVRRRSVNAHHWSRFTLLALDVVLRDLHRLGYNQILKHFEDHVDMVHVGSEYLTKYYTDKNEEDVHNVGDKYGVSWFND